MGLQGLAAQIRKYRNSNIMHPSGPEPRALVARRKDMCRILLFFCCHWLIWDVVGHPLYRPRRFIEMMGSGLAVLYVVSFVTPYVMPYTKVGHCGPRRLIEVTVLGLAV